MCEGDDDLNIKLDFEAARCFGDISSRELAIWDLGVIELT